VRCHFIDCSLFGNKSRSKNWSWTALPSVQSGSPLPKLPLGDGKLSGTECVRPKKFSRTGDSVEIPKGGGGGSQANSDLDLLESDPCRIRLDCEPITTLQIARPRPNRVGDSPTPNEGRGGCRSNSRVQNGDNGWARQELVTGGAEL